MLRIGLFSKLSMVSVRMLRHYEKLGLMMPHAVDTETGYRYYQEEQLETCGKIKYLQNLGFSLSTIAEILECRNDEAVANYFATRKKAVERNYKEVLEQMRTLEGALEKFKEKRDMMNYTVVLKEIPEMNVAALRDILPGYAEEHLLWTRLMAVMGSPENRHVSMAQPPYAIGIFHDESHKDEKVDVEIQMAVTGKGTEARGVAFKKRPPETVASVTFKGSYDQMHAVVKAVASWVKNGDYLWNGPMFNIYHVSPAVTSNPEEWVTEACFPVKKGNPG